MAALARASSTYKRHTHPLVVGLKGFVAKDELIGDKPPAVK
jgi:hypothetical protein